MRSYQLYLIEDEFASHYFGRERMFYQLFKEYSKSSGELRAIILKQINFITKPIPVLRVHQLLHQQLSGRNDFRADQGSYYIEQSKSTDRATLRVYDRSLLVESDGSVDTETIFFEVLRKCETSFLAIDLESKRYGWLKPIKERKFV
ncbi:sporulation inhibitor of replication protein SirA [Bacillus sp. T33-2]|uniref:sporulation inhibitor of replication protein SirA n=1 Tax=Bacillus sp. T33-2 TaxID=2054168 RepID=UPI000C76A405|nr:sporulation inhibitor of replication protein SirA [Bacillus sp. T33-2]PLR94822.1 sporulation inhibitor of replication protein SirA [Bacillus sp. T33-2]